MALIKAGFFNTITWLSRFWHKNFWLKWGNDSFGEIIPLKSSINDDMEKTSGIIQGNLLSNEITTQINLTSRLLT